MWLLTSWASLQEWNGERNSWRRWHPPPCSGAGCLISRGLGQEDLQQCGHNGVWWWHRRVSLHYQQLWGSSDSWQFGRAGPPQTPHTGSCPRCWVWHSSGQFWSPWTGAPENGDGDNCLVIDGADSVIVSLAHLSGIFTERTFQMLAITWLIEGWTWIGFLLSVTYNCNQLRT